MTRQAFHVVAFLFALHSAATVAADWEPIAPGVHYRHEQDGSSDIHVTRVNLRQSGIRIVGTAEADRGIRVSEFARRTKAIVAINADFFDEHMKPAGLAVGPCGPWKDTRDTARMALAAFGAGRGAIFAESDVMHTPSSWITAAVAGWPLLVDACEARTASELPGRESFTHSPHPRTAIGLSADGTLLYLVVADGRRDGVPGLTLPDLAAWMRDELRVCKAVNLDGGGSTAMWVKDRIVNRPSGGKERRVSNHLAVVFANDMLLCGQPSVAARAPAEARPPAPLLTPAQRRQP